jgi:hypothetical protein
VPPRTEAHSGGLNAFCLCDGTISKIYHIQTLRKQCFGSERELGQLGGDQTPARAGQVVERQVRRDVQLRQEPLSPFPSPAELPGEDIGGGDGLAVPRPGPEDLRRDRDYRRGGELAAPHPLLQLRDFDALLVRSLERGHWLGQCLRQLRLPSFQVCVHRL